MLNFCFASSSSVSGSSHGEIRERKVLCVRHGAAADADVRLTHPPIVLTILTGAFCSPAACREHSLTPCVFWPRSEVGILTSTALLNRIIRQVTSEALLQEMVYFLLGEDQDAETQATICQNPLRHRLIEHCDHLSDEVVIAQALLFPHVSELVLFLPITIVFHGLVEGSYWYKSYF